jgi:hypothetical protein
MMELLAWIEVIEGAAAFDGPGSDDLLLEGPEKL